MSIKFTRREFAIHMAGFGSALGLTLVRQYVGKLFSFSVNDFGAS